MRAIPQSRKIATALFILFAIVIALFGQSCNAVQRVLSSPEKKARVCAECVLLQRDSVHITDTIIKFDNDEAIWKALFECDSVGRVTYTLLENQKGENLTIQEVFNAAGTLTIIGKTETVYVPVKGINRTNIKTVTLPGKPYPVETKYIPWHYKALAFLGCLYILRLILLGLSVKFAWVKRLLPIVKYLGL